MGKLLERKRVLHLITCNCKMENALTVCMNGSPVAMLLLLLLCIRFLLDVWSSNDLPCGREFFGIHISNAKHTIHKENNIYIFFALALSLPRLFRLFLPAHSVFCCIFLYRFMMFQFSALQLRADWFQWWWQKKCETTAQVYKDTFCMWSDSFFFVQLK